jgi:hypothetical protein
MNNSVLFLVFVVVYLYCVQRTIQMKKLFIEADCVILTYLHYLA